jgi:hypothetical protein
LFAATFFIVGAINKFSIPPLLNPAFTELFIPWRIFDYINGITFLLWVSSFSLYMLYVKWTNPPRLLLYTVYFTTIFYFIILDIVWILGLPGFTPIEIVTQISLFLFQIIAKIWLLILSLFIIYVYYTIVPVVADRATRNVIRIWLIIGIVLTIEHGIQLLTLVWCGGDIFCSINIIFNELPTYLLTYSIMNVLFTFIGLRYPESFLISQTQIIRAHKLYNEIQTQPKKTQPDYLGMDRILSYLDQVPASVFEKE